MVATFMKPHHYLWLAATLSSAAVAQIPAPMPPVVVETTTTETISPGQKVVEETIVERPVAPIGFNPRNQLSVAPRALPLITPAPGTTTETTETSTTRVGARVYNTERSIVVVEGQELPYVTIPVLFVKETAELLDSESRSALDETANAILEIYRLNPSAKFDIEGHTSTDGADDMNMNLSAQRAKRIYDELTTPFSPPSGLAHRLFRSLPQKANS